MPFKIQIVIHMSKKLYGGLMSYERISMGNRWRTGFKISAAGEKYSSETVDVSEKISDFLAGSVNVNPVCPVGRNIHHALDDKLDRIQKAMEDEMRRITLAEVVKDTRKSIVGEHRE